MTAVSDPPARDDAATRAPAAPAPGASGAARTAVLLLALVGLSVLLRLEGRDVWLWIDEGLSIGIADRPLADIPGVLRQDGSPPLYYVLLHVWIGAFGTGEAALHALSLVFAVACVPAAYWAGTSLFGRRVGWTAAVLAAANPFITYYGREARMYTLVALLAPLAAACHAHVFAFGRRRMRAPLAILVALLLYTHNWALYFVVAAGLTLPLAVVLRRDGARRDAVRSVGRDALVAYGAAGLLYLPWLPTLLGQLRETGAPWSRAPAVREAISELDAVLGDERVLVALLLVAGAGLATVVARRAGRDLPVTTATGTLLLFAVVPLALSWLISQVEPNWATRYFALIVGPILLVAALGLARAGLQGVAALALILLFWTQPLGRITGHRDPIDVAHKSNVRAVAADLEPRLGPDDLVVVTHAEQVPILHHYLPDVRRFANPLGLVPDLGVFDWRNVVDRLRAATPERNLTPLVDAQPVGSTIVLVGPVGELTGDRDPDWFVLFHQRTDEWTAALTADPRLRLDHRVGDPAAAVLGTSLYALVFTKTAA